MFGDEDAEQATAKTRIAVQVDSRPRSGQESFLNAGTGDSATLGRLAMGDCHDG
jgi:hypothetical protein